MCALEAAAERTLQQWSTADEKGVALGAKDIFTASRLDRRANSSRVPTKGGPFVRRVIHSSRQLLQREQLHIHSERVSDLVARASERSEDQAWMTAPDRRSRRYLRQG